MKPDADSTRVCFKFLYDCNFALFPYAHYGCDFLQQVVPTDMHAWLAEKELCFVLGWPCSLI